MIENKEPKYFLLQQELIKKIENGDFSEGKPIMSEREMIRQYNLSRITVRKAIDELVKEGYLYRIQGKGTYVKDNNAQSNLYSLVSCTEDVKKLGRTPFKKTVIAEKVSADAKRANYLHVEVGDLLYSFGRITYADQEPLNYTLNWLPEKIFQGLDRYDLEQDSLYRIISEDYGIAITKARRSIEAVVPSIEVAEYLKITTATPVILFECVTHGMVWGKEVPIEVFRCYYRTDHYKFYIDQVR